MKAKKNVAPKKSKKRNKEQRYAAQMETKLGKLADALDGIRDSIFDEKSPTAGRDGSIMDCWSSIANLAEAATTIVEEAMCFLPNLERR